MADKRKLIDPINGTFDQVVSAIAPKSKRKELGMKSNEIKVLPSNSAKKELDPRQGILDLQIDKQAEIEGIGMVVLRDGTPYLNQRGLAALCGKKTPARKKRGAGAWWVALIFVQ